MAKGIYDRSKSKPRKKGVKFTPEHRLNLSIAHKGKSSWNGKKHSQEARLRMSVAKIGKRPPNFIADRLVVHRKKLLRQTPEWKNWRKDVFTRDNFTCQECKIVGGYLEPHHIVPVRNNDVNQLFNLKNGITLCRSCHQKTIWKEELFEDKYFKITNP